MKQDTKTHRVGGTVVLLASLVQALALLALGLHPVTVVLICAGSAAAASVEGTQWFTNRAAKKNGAQPPHEVSWRDFGNSVAACWIGAAAAEAFVRSHWPTLLVAVF